MTVTTLEHKAKWYHADESHNYIDRQNIGLPLSVDWEHKNILSRTKAGMF